MSVDATVATWKLDKSQVTSSEKLFLLSCADRAGESHECWPSIKRLSANTGLERKTIMKVRQSVIGKGLVEYTGSFQGKTKLIPVMRLTYVDDSVSELSSTENGTVNNNSPKNGTGNSPKNGTAKQSQKRDTEPKRGNLKEEPKRYIPSKDSFGITQMLEDNPHCIPETMIVDWLEVRRVKKAKITLTAWNATNSVLKTLVDLGLNAVECFEHMVARGWQGIKASYFQDEINALSPSPGQLSKEQRSANELKTKERELKAQEEKRKEMDAARNMGNVIGTIRSTMGFKEASKKAEEEMKRLGINENEYHAQVLRQARAG